MLINQFSFETNIFPFNFLIVLCCLQVLFVVLEFGWVLAIYRLALDLLANFNEKISSTNNAM